MSIAILICDAFFCRMSVSLFMIVECGVPLAHSTTHDIYSPTPRAVRRSRNPSTSRSTTTCPPRKRKTLSTSPSERPKSLRSGPFLLPGARPGRPEAQNAPEPAREAQNGVDSRSGILQTPKELVESPFPLRNQTWKETFCSWTRKPNSYPLACRSSASRPHPQILFHRV